MNPPQIHIWNEALKEVLYSTGVVNFISLQCNYYE